MADGEIIIDTHINTDGIEKDANKLFDRTRKIADEVASTTGRMFSKIDTSQFVNSISNLSPELQKLEIQIFNAGNQIEYLKQNLGKYVKVGLFDSATQQINTLSESLNKLQLQKELLLNIPIVSQDDINKTSEQAQSLEQVNSKIQKMDFTARKTWDSFLKVSRVIGTSLVNSSRRAANSMVSIFSGAVAAINAMFSSIGSFIGRVFRRAGWIILGKIIRKLIADINQSFEDLKTFGGNFSESAQQITDAYKRAGNAIAAAFAPVLIALTPIIVNISNAIVNLMNKLTVFTTALFTNSTTATIADINFNGYSRSLNKATKNTRKGTKAAKEQYKTLAKFDKLDVFKRDKKYTTPSADEQLPQALKMFKKVAIPRGVMEFKNNLLKALDEIGRKFKIVANEFNKGFKLGFKEKNLDDIGKKLYSIGQSFKEIFTDKEVVDKFNEAILNLSLNLGRVIGAFASVGVSLAKMLIGGFEKFLNENKERIKKSIIRNLDTTIEFNNLLGSVAEFIAQMATLFGTNTAQNIFGNFLSIVYSLFDTTFSNIYKIVVMSAKNIAKPFLENTDKIQEAAQGALESIERVTSGAKKAIQGAGDTITGVVEKSISPALDMLGDAFSSVFAQILISWNKDIKPVFKDMGERFEVVGERIGKTFGRIGGTFNRLFDLIKKIYDKLKPLLEQYFYPMFRDVFSNIGKAIESTIGVIDEVINGAIDNINIIIDVLDKAINVIGAMIEGRWGDVWETAGNVFRRFIKYYISLVKFIPDMWVEGMNEVLRSVNSIIDSINQIGFFGAFPKIPLIPSIPDNFGIPGLATGTVVSPNRRFLAMLGDNASEPEVVSPISTMKRAFSEAMRDSNISGGTGDITLQIDGKTFARLINPYMDSEKNRVGITMVQGVY